MATQVFARGMGSSPGTATGKLVFRAEDAIAMAADGIATILLRASMTPDDVPGMRAAVGIVATSDGITGDAAIVARSLGKPCVASCPRVRVDYVRGTVTAWAETPGGPDVVVHRGDTLTIDGGTGEIRIHQA